MTFHDNNLILQARNVAVKFGNVHACNDISLAVRGGEVLGIVGESGSGKSTLLRCLGGQMRPDAGSVEIMSRRGPIDLWQADELARIRLMQSDVALVHQNPRDGLLMHISAGGNIAEPLLASGERRYEELREKAADWLERVELPGNRLNSVPSVFSGGMQKRLQIARCLVTNPRLLLMDEPTGGLDVSVQARLLDLLRQLVRELQIAAVVVTHDLAVARVLAQRLVVMRRGGVVETGLTDQILEDPQHPYTQLLVGAALRI
ncbi:putative phosphonate transport system ATP-binding protein [Rhizobium miluonense]|uniref:Putative phosphonate transport system ATP-binding protein n=1 Tax=Rhizobium miluonense TaxID=411945 RepID=A0A1C3WDH6_9HYPH|nr:putative phosphonate transport system ATP-binding protein [Rhizobium miluonense]